MSIRDWFRPKKKPKTAEPSREEVQAGKLPKRLAYQGRILVRGRYSKDEYDAACRMLTELEKTAGMIESISGCWADAFAGLDRYSLQVYFTDNQKFEAMLYKLSWGRDGEWKNG